MLREWPEENGDLGPVTDVPLVAGLCEKRNVGVRKFIFYSLG